MVNAAKLPVARINHATITLISDPKFIPGDASLSAEVTNSAGTTDAAFIKSQVLPGFASGSRIDTARGPVPVEEIAIGDLVLTLDDGLQPVRWRGRGTVPSRGVQAAVVIPPGTLGVHGALRLSPQHRLHITGWRAELYCDEPEVLVMAIHLVHSGLLHQDQSGAPVSYHHLMFDRHQIIRAEGLWSESYFPGPTTLASQDDTTRAEILALFPELATNPMLGYGLPARPEATAHAAALLVG